VYVRRSRLIDLPHTLTRIPSSTASAASAAFVLFCDDLFVCVLKLVVLMVVARS
jgi:hypothetical protein